MASKEKVETTVKKVTKSPVFFSGLGRRKRAVARVWLYAEKGELLVNDKPIDDLFKTEEDRMIWVKPFHTVGVSHPTAKFRATVKVVGGGSASQLEAVALGIARALSAYDAGFEAILRKQGMLRRDPREVEPKHYYMHKARRAPQYSKR
jgi:small subunit ribosomal protein S9